MTNLRPAVLGSAGGFGVVVTLVAWAVDPTLPNAYLTPKTYSFLLASAAAVLFWSLSSRKAHGGWLRITAIEATLAASLLWGFIVSPNWLEIRDGTWFWLSLAALLLTVVVRQRVNVPERESMTVGEPTRRTVALADFMAAVWIVGSALAVHGLAEAFLAGSFQPEYEKTSVVSVTGWPNSFGAFMAAGIIAALASAAQARRPMVRWLLAGAAVLQFVALIGNGSRGALLSLVAAGLIVFWLRPLLLSANRPGNGAHVNAGTRRWTSVVVRGLAVLIAIAIAGLLLHRMNPASGRGRLIAWEISGAMLADKPLTGVGTGRFPREWSRYQTELWRHPAYADFDRQALMRTAPNSVLFHQLAERGLPGGALYVLLWACVFGLVLRALRRGEGTSALDWGLLALLVAIFVHSLVDDTFRRVPALATAHLAFALIPAPILLRADLRHWFTRPLPLAFALGWAAAVAVKTAREYPGYRLWAQARNASAAESLELLERAQRRLHLEPALNSELGNRLLAAGRPEQAAIVLQQGLDKQDGLSFRLTLAEAQLQSGLFEPAEENVRTAAANFPDRLQPRLLLARIHHARGEDAQARAALASCIRRDTYFRSDAVDSVAAQAAQLWRNWYDDEPPG